MFLTIPIYLLSTYSSFVRQTYLPMVYKTNGLTKFGVLSPFILASNPLKVILVSLRSFSFFHNSILSSRFDGTCFFPSQGMPVICATSSSLILHGLPLMIKASCSASYELAMAWHSTRLILMLGVLRSPPSPINWMYILCCVFNPFMSSSYGGKEAS